MRVVFVSVQLGFDTSTSSVHVAVAAVEEGTLMQLHLRDSAWAQQGLRNSVQVSTGLDEAKTPVVPILSLLECCTCCYVSLHNLERTTQFLWTCKLVWLK